MTLSPRPRGRHKLSNCATTTSSGESHLPMSTCLSTDSHRFCSARRSSTNSVYVVRYHCQFFTLNMSRWRFTWVWNLSGSLRNCQCIIIPWELLESSILWRHSSGSATAFTSLKLVVIESWIWTCGSCIQLLLNNSPFLVFLGCITEASLTPGSKSWSFWMMRIQHHSCFTVTGTTCGVHPFSCLVCCLVKTQRH